MSTTQTSTPAGQLDPSALWHDPDRMLVALDHLRGAGAEFGGFLANHGPMAADAMIRLGGGDHVEQWVDEYRRELEPLPEEGSAVTAVNWRDQLGRMDRIGDWTSHMRSAIGDVGWQDTLTAWWPRLLPGAAASATHGLIRTAHAVRNLADGDDRESLLLDELAAGLAFWAARYQTLPGAPGLAGASGLPAAIAALPRLDPAVRSVGPGIGGRLGSLYELRGFPEALDAWGPTTDPVLELDEVISCAARVLVARSEFPIAFCHAVTAPAAIRMILPSLPPEHVDATVGAAWQIAAAIVAAFAPHPDPRETETPDTPTPIQADLAMAAVAHGDEHVIKLTEACLRQFDATGDTALLVAAERYRQRVSRQC